ncbi:MAG: type II toxin-antitoxin system VapC family toxin [Blastocatellia bacterium]
MKLLLDTHAFLWFIMGNSKLSTTARNYIEDTSNDKYISIVSLWEIAIKNSIGKLNLSGSFASVISSQIQLNGFEILDISFQHLVLVSSLPFHHRDPFDRLIISQSIVEFMPILGTDLLFDLYPITRFW